MSAESEKARSFLQRLWDNPSLNDLSPLQKEEQLRQFLKINGSQLQPTLSSAAFFPGRPWSWIQDLLTATLAEMAGGVLNPLIEGILERKIDFAFALQLQHRSASVASMKTQMNQFLVKLASRPESRRELTGPLLAIGSGFVDRYVERIFTRQKYVSFEIRKVQRLKLSPTEVADLIKASLMVRPALQYYAPPGAAPGMGRNPVTVSAAFAAKVLDACKEPLPLMPDPVCRGGVHSALSYQENPYVDSTARLTSIFAQRCRNLKPGMKIDRGAETSDKSWFNVARRNYKFYGYDLDMLVELHSISAENGW